METATPKLALQTLCGDGEAQALLQHHLSHHEAGLKQLREQSALQAFFLLSTRVQNTSSGCQHTVPVDFEAGL